MKDFFRPTNLAKLIGSIVFFSLGTWIASAHKSWDSTLYEYSCTPIEKTVIANGRTITTKGEDCKALTTSVALVVSGIVLALYTIVKGFYFMAINFILAIRGRDLVTAKQLDPDSQQEASPPASEAETKAPEVKT